MKNLIDSAFSKTNSAKTEFENIVSLSTQVKNLDAEVRGSISEQATGSSRLLTSISEMKEQMLTVSQASNNLYSGAIAIKDAIAQLGKTE